MARSVSGSKAALSARTWYVPGGSKRKLNLPPSSEVADLTSPPPSLDRQTITSGRTAPEVSSAKPFTALVDTVWAKSRFADPKLIASIPSRTHRQHPPRSPDTFKQDIAKPHREAH